ncbi:MAG: prefoldin subunit [Candidatus Aenigmarchaeota archaeon]|nr:prefoldin subunit [Candidatus Aenigmarchaeota archaeon]
MEQDIHIKTNQAEAKQCESRLRENIVALQKYEKMLSNIMYTNEKMKLDMKGIEISMEELKKKPKEVYRFYGMILLKKPFDEIKTELEEEKDKITLRQKQLTKQEESIKKMYSELRQKVIDMQKELRETVGKK